MCVYMYWALVFLLFFISNIYIYIYVCFFMALRNTRVGFCFCRCICCFCCLWPVGSVGPYETSIQLSPTIGQQTKEITQIITLFHRFTHASADRITCALHLSRARFSLRFSPKSGRSRGRGGGRAYRQAAILRIRSSWLATMRTDDQGATDTSAQHKVYKQTEN